MAKCTIIDQVWEVSLADPHDTGLYCDGTNCVGATWNGKCQIFISNELTGARAFRTIMHELTHATLVSTQINNQESWDEEAVCNLLGIYGYDLTNAALRLYRELYGAEYEVTR